MTKTLVEHKDGDTPVYRDDETGEVTVGRELAFGTPESVHPNDSLNVPEGDAASEFANIVTPEGSTIERTSHGKDAFGRELGNTVRMVGETPIDTNFVMADQQMGQYYTKYGVHPDPDQHNLMKEYYSQHAPYQYGDTKPPMTHEEFTKVDNLQREYSKTLQAFQDGDATQEELDTAMVNLYADRTPVANYRRMMMQWNRKVTGADHDGTYKFAFDFAAQDEEFRDAYDKAVRNGHLQAHRRPEQEPSFWENLKLGFRKFNSMANDADMEMLYAMREYGDRSPVAESELKLGLTEQQWNNYGARIMAEAEQYGGATAITFKNQLIQDMQDNRDYDRLAWYAQFGYGAAAVIAEPANLVGGAVVGSGVKVASKAVDTLTMSRAMNAAVGVRPYLTSGAVRNTEKLAIWAGAGATESAIMNAPRMHYDHTYNAKDLQVDVMFDAALTPVVGVVGKYAALPLYNKFVTESKKAHKKLQTEKKQWAANKDKEIHGDEVVHDDPIVMKARADAEAARVAAVNAAPTRDARVAQTSELSPAERLKIEEDYANLPKHHNKPRTPEEQKAIAAHTKIENENADMAVLDHIESFEDTGEKAVFEVARQPRNFADRLGRWSSKLTEDLATKFQTSGLTSLEYVGSRITELGRGYGGNIRRRATGSVVRDVEFRDSVMQIVPSYVRVMDEYAASKGANSVGIMNAQQKAGADNKIVNQFNRDVFTVQEYRRQGMPLPEGIHPSVLKFVDDWDKFMNHNHSKLVEANIKGFSRDKKIQHYLPHVWLKPNMDAAIKKHGKAKVHALLSKAYSNSSKNTEPMNVLAASKLADRQMNWVRTQTGETVDQYSPVVDARTKQRLDLDTTTELDGLHIMDLLDTDVMALGTKYASRMSGWVGLSKSTDGLLTSHREIDALKRHIIEEGKGKKIDTTKHEQWFDDLVHMMMGRPTRGGLNQELRMLKDITALTRMGGLGTAQLIETGQVVTRNTLTAFSDPDTAAKVFALAGESVNNKELMAEIQTLSGLTNDLEWLDRQSVHLDQAELETIGKTRAMSLWIADKATFGSAKAPASRLLGKTTGYNAIRRAQSRVTQASFVNDIAKHFKHGTGKMGNARMADVGVTDVHGENKGLREVFTDGTVQFNADGSLAKLNIEHWPKSVREDMQYAMVRDEAQQIQRTLIGELMPWMNKPMMALIFQFRSMPLVANNKSLGRALAFADKEAVTAVMLNAAMSGLVRFSKFAALGYVASEITGDEWTEPSGDQMQVDKYITQFGIFPDAVDLVKDAYTAGQDGNWERLLGQVPSLGQGKDYWDFTTGSDRRDRVDAAQGIVPLGNTAYGEMIHGWLTERMEDIKAPEKFNGVPYDPKAGGVGAKSLMAGAVGAAGINIINQKPSQQTPIPNSQVPKRTLYGSKAVAKVEQTEGKLTPEMKGVIKAEGFVPVAYLDSKGIPTYGVGQTGKWMDKTFKESYKYHEDRVVKRIPNFKSLPEYLRVELIKAEYRGSLGGSPAAVKLINKGEYAKAATEFLDNDEYKSSKTKQGIKDRMKAVATALNKAQP